MSTTSPDTSLPKEIDRILKCNWYDNTSGIWACYPKDGFTWRPRNIILLNALPLNAFLGPTRLDVYPVSTDALLNTLANLNLPMNYKCYIGHRPTIDIITKYLGPINCTRGMYAYTPDTDLIVAFVLRSRPNSSGVDVNVDVSDLLTYVIIPSLLYTSYS
jgi:hypothetical protein